MTRATPGLDDQPRHPSPRLRLARVAHDAAVDVPGVLETDSGPSGRYVTASASERLEGVVCAATSDGGYSISIRLIADLVPLPELGERVQAAVRQASRTAGVPLSSVSVHIAGLAAPGDFDDVA